jgi:hypothetical protein
MLADIDSGWPLLTIITGDLGATSNAASTMGLYLSCRNHRKTLSRATPIKIKTFAEALLR